MLKKQVPVAAMICALLSPSAFAARPPAGPSTDNSVVVAKNGGDFSSIQQAINSLTCTADFPCLVTVLPGTYSENISIAKSYLTLRGSGNSTTTISTISSSPAMLIESAVDVTVADLKIITSDVGIYLVDSRANIVGNVLEAGWGVRTLRSAIRAMDNRISAQETGFELNYDGPGKIYLADNEITGVNGILGGGIIVGLTTAEIVRNRISRFDVSIGTQSDAGDTTIRENTLTDNGRYGIYIAGCLYGWTVIDHNILAQNGLADVWLGTQTACTVSINFNILNSIMGDAATGLYNVTPGGVPLSVP